MVVATLKGVAREEALLAVAVREVALRSGAARKVVTRGGTRLVATRADNDSRPEAMQGQPALQQLGAALRWLGAARGAVLRPMTVALQRSLPRYAIDSSFSFSV